MGQGIEAGHEELRPPRLTELSARRSEAFLRNRRAGPAGHFRLVRWPGLFKFDRSVSMSKMDPSDFKPPPVEESTAQLRRSGWTIGDCAVFNAKRAVLWLAYGCNDGP